MKRTKRLGASVFAIVLATMMTATALASTISTLSIEPIDSYVGEVGYTSSNISKPKEILTTKNEVLNAMNYHLTKMDQEFSLYIYNYSESKMPKNLNELERYFVDEIQITKKENEVQGLIKIQVTFIFNQAGQIVRSFLHGIPIHKEEKESLEAEKIVKEIIEKVRRKSDYEKIVFIHDYAVENTQYDVYEKPESATVHGVLIGHYATDIGYTETLQMFYTILGIENRVVFSQTNSGKGSHWFNKVKLDGDWYNVDATVDDPFGIDDQNIVRTYLLVSDVVSRQRYTWEDSRYPVARVENNWHMRNGLAVHNQKELEEFMIQAIEDKKEFVSVWVSDYDPEKYNIFSIKEKYPEIKLTGTYAPGIQKTSSHKMMFPCATALVYRIKYPE